MSELRRIRALLSDTDLERRLAAAVVLGALEVKDKEVQGDLEKLLSASPEEQRVALDAFARIGPKRILPKVFELLTHGAPPVREAAARALKAAGEDVVPEIRARREKAGEVEKRELDRVLAELSGADAFKALVDGLASADEKTARAAALAVRDRVLGGDKRQRKTYASTTLKALTKTSAMTPQHEAALLKILGWCEDESTMDTILEHLNDSKKPSVVRQEAIVALRFAVADGKAGTEVVEALLDAATGDDMALARTACDVLAGLQLDERAIPKLKSLALHRDFERARFGVLKLKTSGGAKTLVEVVLQGDKRVAEEAREALLSMPDATQPALAAIVDARDVDRGRMLADVLKPRATTLGKPAVRKLVDAIIDRLSDSGRGYEGCLAVARAADAELVAESLRELAAKLKKAKKEERAAHVLILLTNTEGATDDDRMRLAILALKKSRLDVRPDQRARDECIRMFGEIAGVVDIVSALKRDKTIGEEQLFYLGFHFTEEGDPIGEELLKEVISRSPRGKLGKAAKNKLKLEA